jgi:hypothetical protein
MRSESLFQNIPEKLLHNFFVSLGLVLILGFAASIKAQANLLFLQAPQGEVAQDSLIKISVGILPLGTKAPNPCVLLESPSSTGAALATHTTSLVATQSWGSDTTSRLLSFKPSTVDSKGVPQLGLGFHYLIVGCQEGKYVSAELPLWVTSRQSATILTPKADEYSASPNISWTPVPGVPAYHILLSDQALVIDPDKGSVSGASIIWQAITTGTSIAYGSPDPSKNFYTVAAPPLSPNVPYNLVILNNYDGRSALATSSKAQGLKLFTIKSQAASLSKPNLSEPTSNKLMTAFRDSSIRFKWSASKAGSTTANTYKLYLYALETQDYIDVLIPVFQSEVTDTFAVLDAKRTLLTKRYIWKVFALNEAGTGIVSDTSSFQYRNDVQTLSINMHTSGSYKDTVDLADVRIEVAPLDGSADALPLFSVSTGLAEKVLTVGSYRLSFSKNGYLSQTRTVILDLQAPLHIDQFLWSAPNRITGHLVDWDGRDVANVIVTGIGGGKTVTTLSDAYGAFLLGVESGNYSVSFAKTDFQPPPDTVLYLANGKSIDLGKLVLRKPSGSLNGIVSNDKGIPLPGCQVLISASSGGLLRTLFTDDKGGFSASIAPGRYVVVASRTGFTSQEKVVQLTEAANVSLSLTPGASVIKGHISILNWKLPEVSQSTPLPGAIITLVPKASTVSMQKSEADLRGEYAFSVDPGSYTIKVSKPESALPESTVVNVTASRSTLNQDIVLKGFATIQGALTMVPDTVVNPSKVSVSLLKANNSALIRTVVPQAAPKPGGSGTMSFFMDGVPDGDYRITCGLPTFGLDAEPTLTIAKGVWKTDVNLTLRKSNKALTLALTSGGKFLPGIIRLLTPQAVEIAAGYKLTQASSGTYTLNAFPDSLPLIPVTRYSFALPSGGVTDTTIPLVFPFSHQVSLLPLKNQEVEITLQAGARIDSMFIFFGYGTPSDSVRVPANQLIGPPGSKALHFKPGNQGGLLTYYFVIYSGSLTYTNSEASRRFRAQVTGTRELSELRVSAGDSLRFAAKSLGEILLHAYDATGRRLDTSVDNRGTVVWTADPGLPIRLGKRSRRTLLLQTETPKQILAKRSSSILWDTLRVTVTLDGIERSLALPTQVVPNVINKIVLSTTLGEVSELPAPTDFGLFVSGFDTTTTPPTPMTPNAEFHLDPVGAGTVKEMQVSINPRFIGPLRISALHSNLDGSEASTELGFEKDTLERGINIGQTLRLQDTARILFHDPSFELLIKDSSFTAKGQVLLRLFKRALAKSFASGVTESVTGKLYEITNPSGAVFTKAPRLSLGIPVSARLRRNELRRFEVRNLDWSAMPDSIFSDSNSFFIPALSSIIEEMDGNYYGLLTKSQSLTAGTVEVLPNPFSPLVMATRDGNTQYGTRIRLQPESNRSAEVTISIKIYNMDGELMRHLVEHKTVPKAPVDFYWDGKVDGGRWARNGRYLVKVSVNSTGTPEIKYLVKPVVLFQ